MKRILCIVSTMNRGGAETFLMKIYRNLDHDKFNIDFYVNAPGAYDKEIISLGGNIFYGPSKSENFLKYRKTFKTFLKTHKYETVLRLSSTSLSYFDFKYCKKFGIKKVVMRATNTNSPSKFGNLMHKIFIRRLNKIVDVKLSPSRDSALYTFGKKEVESGNVTIINNAINFDQYKFNELVRDKIRSSENLNNKLVIVHVGRFNPQKNHQFTINMAKKLIDYRKDFKVLLFGEGKDKETFLKLCKENNLEQYIEFRGNVNNINEYYSAADILILPSLFEGLPNVVIEAQAAGLKCYISNTITKDCNITGDVFYLPLDIDIWARNIAIEKCDYARKDTLDIFKNAHYLIEDSLKIFIDKVY